jgi:hypothetical protein
MLLTAVLSLYVSAEALLMQQALWLLNVPSALILQISTFCLQGVFVGFV